MLIADTRMNGVAPLDGGNWTVAPVVIDAAARLRATGVGVQLRK